MDRYRPVPFAGGSYADETMPWTQQDTVNYLPTLAEREGTRSPAILKQCPGLLAVANASGEGGGGPIRAAYNCEGRLLVVSGTVLYWVKTDYTAEAIGTIPGTGRVSIAHNQVENGFQVLIATGDAGYVYSTVDGTLAPITDEGYPGAMCVRFMGQYLVQVAPSRKYLFHSDLADAFSYSTIDRFAAEGSPDRLYSLEVNGGRLLAFGERTIEVYDNIVTENSAFQRSGNVIDRGVAGPHSTCVLDGAAFFLGNDRVMYRMDGYTPARISTHAMEAELRDKDVRRAFLTTWESDGHKVVYLTVPSGKTWGYDAASREWHRRKSYGLDRWRANTLTDWNSKTIAGDYSSGKLYEVKWGHATEDGEPLERDRVFAVLHSDFARVPVNAVRFLVDSGSPGSGDNIVCLRYTDDGGRNWSQWRNKGLGAEGNRLAPVIFRQMGQTRHRIYHLSDTSAYRNDIVAAGIA